VSWWRKRDPLDAFVARLKREGRDGRLRLLEPLPRRDAEYAEPSPPLPLRLSDALRAAGVPQLYRHQVELLAHVRAGDDVALVTPTASGKTLAFATAICERWLMDRTARAICVYPTNALIHDQERALRAFTERLAEPPRIATLTGATPLEERRALRSRPPAILLTNPELLHMSLAGGQAGWAGLLAGLAFVVLDEAHSYRGVFGAHMALTVRRLLRAACGYGATPRLILCTATVGNPAELAEALSGRACAVVEGPAGTQGERTFAVWRADTQDDRPFSVEAEAARLFAESVKAGLGTILFMPSRRGVERAVARARAIVGPQQAMAIAPYRGGYTPAQRRRLEGKLRDGALRGVVATNALEIGIDVGGLAVAITAGFPGSRTSLWQQLGRAGRNDRPSLGLFVPYPRAVDAYYAEHPRALLARPFEDAVVDLGNGAIVAQHLLCAAAESPLLAADATAFCAGAPSVLAEALRDGRLYRLRGRLYARDGAPHGAVRLRGGAGESLELICAGVLIGTLDAAQLGREAYPGATYLHEAIRYRVVDVDERKRRVELVRDAAAPDTMPVIRSSVHLQGTAIAGEPGALLIKRTTAAYVEQTPGRGDHGRLLDPPISVDLLTKGFWLRTPSPDLWPAGRDGSARLAALHALEHLLPAAAAIALACDPRDLVATAIADHRQAGGDAIFLYDAVEGGSGLAERVARQPAALLRLASQLVGDCPCRKGCPRCVMQGGCWRAHAGTEKALARDLLLAMRR
jgi:DEAD/DEAH box helicase domain-containing protein